MSATSTQTDECVAHATCKPGEWTVNTGNETANTQCSTCGNGRYRSHAPENTDTETSEAEACTGVHKTCSRGEWTEATGTSTHDTQCKPCPSGAFKESISATSTETDECVTVTVTHSACKPGYAAIAGNTIGDTQCVPAVAVPTLAIVVSASAVVVVAVIGVAGCIWCVKSVHY